MFFTILISAIFLNPYDLPKLIKLRILNNTPISTIIVNTSGRRKLYNSDSNNVFYILEPRKESIRIESFGYLPYHLKVLENCNEYLFSLNSNFNSTRSNIIHTISTNNSNLAGNKRKSSHGKFSQSEGVFIGQKISYLYESDVSNPLQINIISIYINKIVSSIDSNYLVIRIFEIDNLHTILHDTILNQPIFSDTSYITRKGWVSAYPNTNINSGLFCYQIEYLEPIQHITNYTGLEHLGVGVYKVKFNKNIVKFSKSGRIRIQNSNLTYQTKSETQNGQSAQAVHFIYSIY